MKDITNSVNYEEDQKPKDMSLTEYTEDAEKDKSEKLFYVLRKETLLSTCPVHSFTRRPMNSVCSSDQRERVRDICFLFFCVLIDIFYIAKHLTPRILRSLNPFRLHIILILLFPLFAYSSENLEISGYVKYLSSASDYPGVEDTLYDQLVHARINTAWYPTDSLRGKMDIRLRAFYGDSIEKIREFSEEVKTDYDFTNLDAEIWEGKKSLGYVQIDRLWLDYTNKDLQITLGRQRIAWGTSLVWNVIDLFNPKSVLDFDYEEKPGADAVRMQYYTGAVSKVELSVRPGKDNDHSTIAGLYSINILGYDFYGIAGVRNNRWVTGCAWAGSVLDGGFRGEVLVSQSPDRDVSRGSYPFYPPGESIFDSHRAVVSFVISGDYTFSNTFYIHSECLYNSNGKIENGGLFWQEASDAGMLSPARWSIYQEFAYDITPLTRATVFGIYNPDDHSYIIMPMLSRSLITNLDLLFIGLLPSGGQNTEYGVYGKSINLRLKYSF